VSRPLLRRRDHRGARLFRRCHRALGRSPVACYVELHGDDVTECVGGSAGLAESTRSATATRRRGDPRRTGEQALATGVLSPRFARGPVRSVVSPKAASGRSPIERGAGTCIATLHMDECSPTSRHAAARASTTKHAVTFGMLGAKRAQPDPPLRVVRPRPRGERAYDYVACHRRSRTVRFAGRACSPRRRPRTLEDESVNHPPLGEAGLPCRRTCVSRSRSTFQARTSSNGPDPRRVLELLPVCSHPGTISRPPSASSWMVVRARTPEIAGPAASRRRGRKRRPRSRRRGAVRNQI